MVRTGQSGIASFISQLDLPPTSTTTTAASATTATAVSAVAAATISTSASHISKLRGNLLFGFAEDGEKVAGLLVVVGGEEGNGSSLGTMGLLVSASLMILGVSLPSTTSTSDTMNVILRVIRVTKHRLALWTKKGSGRNVLKVNNVSDVTDILRSSS